MTSAAPSVATVGAIACTANVTGELVPVGLPIELGWLATAVYTPHGRAGLALPETHSPPRASPVAVATIGPVSAPPSWISTVTGAWSLAVPENAGTLFGDGDGSALSVTVGGAVSTMNVTCRLWPGGLPIALCCTASAVNTPLLRAGEARSEIQLPPLAVAVAVEST